MKGGEPSAARACVGQRGRMAYRTRPHPPSAPGRGGCRRGGARLRHRVLYVHTEISGQGLRGTIVFLFPVGGSK